MHSSREYVISCVTVVRRGHQNCEPLCLCETGGLIHVHMFLFSAPAPEEHKPPSETSHTGGVVKGTSTFVY